MRTPPTARNAFPTVTSHTVSDLEEGTGYSVRVRARYHDGDGDLSESGPWSASVEITVATPPPPPPTEEPTEEPTPPAKPTGLSTTPSHDSVVLAWTDPGDSAITGYQVLRGPDAANLAVLAGNTGSAATGYTDDTVEAATTYAYAIRAKNTDGLSPQSDTVSITTAAAAPPAKPTGLSTSPSHDSVLLSWTDPGDSSITSYQVLRGPDAANLTVLVNNTGTTASSYTDDSVAAETAYTYAVRARNSDGLSPQSDTISVTTPEAPVAEQVAIGDFTLDGQALDTSGTCSEDDIAAIAEACTINITTRSPVFAVHGTVDSDDRITVKTGRDSAAVNTATTATDQDDLRGTDRTATLTLAEGRHLLRLWADEDTSSGGSEEHFFRVNIRPYWELNDERLSKDSDCRSATDPTLGDITDGDCIVAQSGNSGSIRFHNVTTGHFNVYVSVNGSEVVREPGDTALGGPFAVELQGGDNLLRVRLASKGNTHGAESYGRNAFYYKITTPSPPAKPIITGQGSGHATAFLTWDDPGDDSVTGYQVLRGLAADTLAVLADDTESTDTPYTDETVEPETQYFYAIRARNAAGLSPQSDTVSTTTQAAPPEIIAERSTAGFEITLDGQTLDTDTACDEDDVASIPEGCTVNIETRSPIFAVDGTVDTDDRIAITTGRDKAAVDAASESADESNLRGADQSVALTFPEGRSLLQIVTDEDEAAGGSETHYFRVNVVPYWELNGQRLSKDSACQSATARTATQITDADCILSNFKGGSFSFHNVINEHFNAYVDVNTLRKVDAPGNTALADPFTVNLQDGENVVRVRLAAKGSQPHAEVYDSDVFYYKVTGTDVLVANSLSTNVSDVTANMSHAAQFTTGDGRDGYTISAVELQIQVTAGTVPSVMIFYDNSGEPGSSRKALVNPTTLPTAYAWTSFDAEDYQLESNTSYWIVVQRQSGTGDVEIKTDEDGAEDPGAASGWSIGDLGYKFTGGVWVAQTETARQIPSLRIKGEFRVAQREIVGSVSEENGVDFPTDTSTRGAVIVGESVTGAGVGRGDRDWFAVSLKAGERYYIQCWDSEDHWAPVHPFLVHPAVYGIYDRDNTRIYSGFRGNCDDSPVLFLPNADGIYYLEMGVEYCGCHRYHPSIYGLNVSVVPDDCRGTFDTNCNIEAAGNYLEFPLPGRAGYPGKAKVKEVENDRPGDRDWFRLSVDEGYTYAIRLQKGLQNYYPGGYLQRPYPLERPVIHGVYKSDGIRIHDKRSSSFGTITLHYQPSADEDVYIEVGGEGNHTGSYILKVVKFTDDYGFTPDTGGTITVGDTKTALIGYAVDRDLFSVQLQGGTTYQIDAVGALTNPDNEHSTDCWRVNPAINRVSDMEGTNLDNSSDDDGGDICRAARVTVTPTDTGTYYIMIEARRYPGSSSFVPTGSYTLTATATP